MSDEREQPVDVEATDEPSVMVSGGVVYIPTALLTGGATATVTMTYTVRIVGPEPAPAAEAPPARPYMGQRPSINGGR